MEKIENKMYYHQLTMNHHQHHTIMICHQKVPPIRITRENVEKFINEWLLMNKYIYLEDPYYIHKNRPEVIQVFAEDRINQNIYNTSRRKVIASDRINARLSATQSRSYLGSETGAIRPGGAAARRVLEHIDKPGPSGLAAQRRKSNISENLSESEWIEKVFGAKKKKLPPPKFESIAPAATAKPKSILKKKHNFSTSLLRVKSKNRQRKTSLVSTRAWAEDSREQFLNTLTKENYEDRKKDHLANVSGRHDTDIMGLEIPRWKPKFKDPSDEEPVTKSKRKRVMIS